MTIESQFDREAESIDRYLDEGRITPEEHRRAMIDLRREFFESVEHEEE